MWINHETVVTASAVDAFHTPDYRIQCSIYHLYQSTVIPSLYGQKLPNPKKQSPHSNMSLRGRFAARPDDREACLWPAISTSLGHPQ
jgi:hypothetical protein